MRRGAPARVPVARPKVVSANPYYYSEELEKLRATHPYTWRPADPDDDPYHDIVTGHEWPWVTVEPVVVPWGDQR